MDYMNMITNLLTYMHCTVPIAELGVSRAKVPDMAHSSLAWLGIQCCLYSRLATIQGQSAHPTLLLNS